MAGSALLRQARREDALRLHELHTASVRTLCASHYGAEIIDGWLKNRSADGYLAPIKRGVLFVAQPDNRIIGFGEAAAGVVVAVYVDPSGIRQGVGSALLSPCPRAGAASAQRPSAGRIDTQRDRLLREAWVSGNWPSDYETWNGRSAHRADGTASLRLLGQSSAQRK